MSRSDGLPGGSVRASHRRSAGTIGGSGGGMGWEEEGTMEDVHVRQDPWTPEVGPDAVWDERLLAYARAVGVLKARPAEDPLGWIGLASLHVGRPRGTWYLLPWLRMHLWYLERVLRAAIVASGGAADWALPYWGYADADAAGERARAALPAAFAAPELPDGGPNPLHRPDGDRAPFLNSGFPLPAAVTNA